MGLQAFYVFITFKEAMPTSRECISHLLPTSKCNIPLLLNDILNVLPRPAKEQNPKTQDYFTGFHLFECLRLVSKLL